MSTVDMVLNLTLGVLLGALGLALATGHLRPGERFSAAAVERTADRDDRAVRRLRKMHQRTPVIHRWIGWGLFWSSLWGFSWGLMQAFGVWP